MPTKIRLFYDVREAIKENRPRVALEILFKHIEKFQEYDFRYQWDCYNKLLLTSAQLESLSEEKILNLISGEEASIRHNKIIWSILSITDTIEKQAFPRVHHSRFYDKSKSTIRNVSKSIEQAFAEYRFNHSKKIELYVDQDLSNLSTDDQEELLDAIKKILDILGTIKLSDVKKGSVIFSFDLLPKKAEKLIEAIERGELSEYGVISGTVVDKKYSELNSENMPRLPGTKNNLSIILEEEGIDPINFCESVNISRTVLASAIASERPSLEIRSMIIWGLEHLTGKSYSTSEVFPGGNLSTYFIEGNSKV